MHLTDMTGPTSHDVLLMQCRNLLICHLLLSALHCMMGKSLGYGIKPFVPDEKYLLAATFLQQHKAADVSVEAGDSLCANKSIATEGIRKRLLMDPHSKDCPDANTCSVSPQQTLHIYMLTCCINKVCKEA